MVLPRTAQIPVVNRVARTMGSSILAVDLAFTMSLAILGLGLAAAEAPAQSSFYTGTDLDHASDEGNDPWSTHQHHRRNHHSHKLWSGSLGLTIAHCVHRASGVVVDDLTSPDGDLAGSVPCSSTADTESSIGPPDTGISLDAAVNYKLSRRWSIGASLAYEPAPGVVVPEVAIDATEPLNARTDWVQEISATSLYARGEPAPPIPEVIRLSEAINWAPRGFHANAEIYFDFGFGSVNPLITSQRRRLFGPTPRLAPGTPRSAASSEPAAAVEDSTTTGIALDGDRALSKAWAYGVAVAGSARHGAETLPSPPTLVELTPASLIWRRGPWSDTGALTMTAAHFGGPYNIAIEFSVQRDL